MRTRLVRIGNSKGIRIPKPLIEQAKLHGDIEITFKGDSLVIRPATKPREGWAEAFKEMAKHGDDALLDGPVATQWDQTEWQW